MIILYVISSVFNTLKHLAHIAHSWWFEDTVQGYVLYFILPIGVEYAVQLHC